MRKVGLILAALMVVGYAQVDHFDFTISPGAKTAGTPFGITIEGKDASGNIEDWTGTINLSLVDNLDNSIGEISPNKDVMAGGRFSKDVISYWADSKVRIKCSGGGATSISPSFSVSPEGAARVQIIFPGEERKPGTRGRGKSGDPFGGNSWYSGVPCSTWVYYTDEWWNPVNQEIEVKFSSTDKYYTTAPRFPFKFSGEKLIFSTFTQVGCPFPTKGYAEHSVAIEPTTHTDIKSDSSKPILIVPDTIVHKVMWMGPGETADPGSKYGTDSIAKVYAFEPFNIWVYVTDNAYNGVKGKYIPSDMEVWLEAFPPGGVEFELLEDTKGYAREKGVRFRAKVKTDHPEKGERRLTLIAIAEAPGLEKSYSKDFYWEAIPDMIAFEAKAPPDTIPVKVETPVTVEVTAGGSSYISERVDFKLVKGEGEFDRESEYTDNEGKASVTFIPASPGPTTIKACLHRFPDSCVTKTVEVIGVRELFARPNPWETGNKVKLYYVLKSDVRSVTILIADIFGNVVRKWTYGEGDYIKAGTRIIEWDGTNMKGEKVANAIYLVKVKPSGVKTLRTKVVVIR